MDKTPPIHQTGIGEWYKIRECTHITEEGNNIPSSLLEVRIYAKLETILEQKMNQFRGLSGTW